MTLANPTTLPDTTAARGNPATRELLLQAAVRVLDRTNFFDTGVDDIVQEAGLARGTFYIYFKDKYDLLMVLIQRLHVDMVDQSLVHLEDATTPYDRLRLALRRVFGFWEKNAGVYRAMNEVIFTRKDFLKMDQELRFDYIRQMKADIERVIGAGHAPQIDAAVVAKALAAMMDRFCLTWFALDEPPYQGASENIDSVTDNLAQMWYRAIYGADPDRRELAAKA